MLIPPDSLIKAICHELWLNAKMHVEPFPHLVIDSVLHKEFVLGLAAEIDDVKAWFRYDSPLERKSTCNDWHQFGPYLYRYFEAMLSQEVTDVIGKRFAIDGLRPDVGLHGGGVHLSGDGDKLNVHQDYSIHPKLGMERRINVIFHVEPMWQESFGGHLELWNGDERPVQKVADVETRFNRMVVFATSPGSWHGYADPIDCPESISRKSLATYYVSAPTEAARERFRANYAPAPNQEKDAFVIGLIERRRNLQ